MIPLARLHRQALAEAPAEAAGERPGREHDRVGLDHLRAAARSRRGADPLHPSPTSLHTIDRHALADLRSLASARLGESVKEAGRLEGGRLRIVDAADQIRGEAASLQFSQRVRSGASDSSRGRTPTFMAMAVRAACQRESFLRGWRF